MNRLYSLLRTRQTNDGKQFLFAHVAAQVIAWLGAIPGVLSILFNAEFDAPQALSLARFATVTFVICFAATLLFSWLITRVARKRLDEIAAGSARPDAKAELLAWREITRFSVRFGISSAAVFFVFLVLPTVTDRKSVV